MIGLSYQILLTNIRKNTRGQEQNVKFSDRCQTVLPRSFVI